MPSQSGPKPRDEETIRAEARQVRNSHDELARIFNPPEFEQAAQAALPENKAAALLRKEFTVREYVYDTIWPDENALHPSERPTVEDEIGPVHADLKVFIAIPNRLLKSEVPVDIKTAIRVHGGGGVSDPNCGTMDVL
jgi:hypothetical protein